MEQVMAVNYSKTRILNIDIDNLTTEELLESFDEGILVTPNIDHLIKLQKDEEFYECYQQAAYTVCDSRIIYLLSKVFSRREPLRAQITGSDFFPAFCDYHAARRDKTSVFLLGGTDQSVQLAADRINKRTGRHIIVGGYSPPFGFENDEAENDRIIDLIEKSGANVVAVGVGAPKQEKWICRNRHRLPGVRIFMAIGATIDFESGTVRRAPRWMSRFGVEWIYRMLQEPNRLARRYLVEDSPFFFLLLKQSFGAYKNPWRQEDNRN